MSGATHAFSEFDSVLLSSLKTHPKFLLSVTPTVQTVIGGQTATYDFTVDALGGFKEPVKFSIYRCLLCLPSGVSASLDPISGTTGSKLTIKTQENTKDGIYLIDVSGISGNLKRTQSVALCVMSYSDFSIKTEPMRQTIHIGDTAIFNVDVSGSDAFNSLVDFEVRGLPIGGTGTFTREPCGSSSVLTITTGRTPEGEYELEITGTSGNFTHSTRVNLSITQ